MVRASGLPSDEWHACSWGRLMYVCAKCVERYELPTAGVWPNANCSCEVCAGLSGDWSKKEFCVWERWFTRFEPIGPQIEAWTRKTFEEKTDYAASADPANRHAYDANEVGAR